MNWASERIARNNAWIENHHKTLSDGERPPMLVAIEDHMVATVGLAPTNLTGLKSALSAIRR